MKKTFEVGDKVKLCGCPYNLEIPSGVKYFEKLFSLVQTVIKTKMISGVWYSCQWIKTDKEKEWLEAKWYNKTT